MINTKDIAIIFDDLMLSQSMDRTDDEPVKVELHLHTQMSSMDGILCRILSIQGC